MFWPLLISAHMMQISKKAFLNEQQSELNKVKTGSSMVFRNLGDPTIIIEFGETLLIMCVWLMMYILLKQSNKFTYLLTQLLNTNNFIEGRHYTFPKY